MNDKEMKNYVGYGLILDGKMYPQLYYTRDKVRGLQQKILECGLAHEVVLVSIEWDSSDVSKLNFKNGFVSASQETGINEA